MEKTGHYKQWKEDFSLVKESGIEHLRYGPPYYKCHIAPGKYDWSFSDETFKELERLNIVPIVDLCHFGVPDWIGNFQNPDFCSNFLPNMPAHLQSAIHGYLQSSGILGKKFSKVRILKIAYPVGYTKMAKVYYWQYLLLSQVRQGSIRK